MLPLPQCLAVLLLLLAACGKGVSSSGPPESDVQIDMDGTWAVADIERRDSAAPLPTASPIGTPLFPLAVGQFFTIRDGVATGPGDVPLFEDWGGVAPASYTNVADGRLWRLDVATAWQTTCTSTLMLHAEFRPIDDETMFGFVAVQYGTDCSPSFLDNEPNGLFAVRLTRITQPAATVAAPSPR